jgi:transcriptional regulator with XRE-family HTH domain
LQKANQTGRKESRTLAYAVWEAELMGSHQNIENDKTKMIGERIRRARLVAGFSQMQLAELTGLSETSLARYERGLRSISADDLLRIAKVTGVSMDWLVAHGAASRSPFSDIEDMVALCSPQRAKFIFELLTPMVKKLADGYGE